MNKIRTVFFVLLVVIATQGFAREPRVGELLVFNNWSTDAEIGALNVIRNEFQARGGTWNDITIAHSTGASIPLINMITGGNPPDVFIESNIGLRRELMKQNLLADLTPFYNSLDVDQYIPQAAKDAMFVDGKVVSIPLGIHIVGSLFYSIEVAEKAGVDPQSWESMDDMFADFPQIRDAGYIPVAIGAQKWQLEYLLGALLCHASGDIYDDICGLDPQRDAIDSPAMREALEYFRRIQQEADPGSTNRNYNETTDLVIRGDALMQIHGDWMKGVFISANKTLGVDYDTMFLPGATDVVVTVDEETFLKPNNRVKRNTQELLAGIMLDREITEQFAAIKGSTPIRLDAVDGMDKHATMVLEALSDPDFGHPVKNITMDNDYAGAFADATDEFWNTPDMTADEFIRKVQASYDQIFNF